MAPVEAETEPEMGAVPEPPMGAVEPLGATGPDSSV